MDSTCWVWANRITIRIMIMDNNLNVWQLKTSTRETLNRHINVVSGDRSQSPLEGKDHIHTGMSKDSRDRETQIPSCTLIHPRVVFGITTPSKTCGLDARCVQTPPTQTGRTKTQTPRLIQLDNYVNALIVQPSGRCVWEIIYCSYFPAQKTHTTLLDGEYVEWKSIVKCAKSKKFQVDKVPVQSPSHYYDLTFKRKRSRWNFCRVCWWHFLLIDHLILFLNNNCRRPWLSVR